MTTYEKRKAKFWSLVVKQDDGCWQWQGNIPASQKGYGRIAHMGAHRFSYEMHGGILRKG